MVDDENPNITPSSDVIFKNIFGNEKNKKLLESLLEAILNKNVEVERVQKSKELNISNILDKVGILDVEAILKDGTIVNIEMQSNPYEKYNKRVLYYLGELVSGQIDKGEAYKEIKDVIIINIMGYPIRYCKEFYNKYEIRTIKNDKIKIDGATIYFLSIPKFEKEKGLLEENVKYEDVVKSKLDEWFVYFSYKNKELLDMVKVQNMDIEEAVQLYSDLRKRRDVTHLYRSRVIAEMDNQVRLECAVERAEKRAERRAKKRAEERAEKKAEEKLKQIIKNMLNQNISKDIIAKSVDISEEKLNSLISNN